MTIRKEAQSGTTIFKTSRSYTIQSEIEVEESVADGVTDQEHLLAIDVSQLKGFYMSCDVALTVETNSGSTPQETFTLAAGEAIVWETGDTAIFSGDVTALYLTNASGSAGTFKLLAGMDV